MEHLPPVGWADVLMKRDLDAFEDRVGLRFDAMDHRFETLEERIDRRFRAGDQRFETLGERIDLRYETLKQKPVAAIRGELQTALTAQTRRIAITFAVTAGALSALTFAAGRLA